MHAPNTETAVESIPCSARAPPRVQRPARACLSLCPPHSGAVQSCAQRCGPQLQCAAVACRLPLTGLQCQEGHQAGAPRGPRGASVAAQGVGRAAAGRRHAAGSPRAWQARLAASQGRAAHGAGRCARPAAAARSGGAAPNQAHARTPADEPAHSTLCAAAAPQTHGRLEGNAASSGVSHAPRSLTLR